MNEDEQREFDEAKVAAEEAVENLKLEKEGREEDKVSHETAIAEKDAVIEQKKNDVIGARRKYKKLSEMSDEEKESLTEKEHELQKRQEEQDERQESFEQIQKDIIKKESGARRKVAILELAGEDKELADKITENYEKIKGSEEASTEEEIANFTSSAFNMLGIPKKEGVENAISSGGDGGAGEVKEGDFSESERGKNIADSLGLGQNKETKTE